MKRAIPYIRISDKDQSHFSITGQERAIREFCEKENILLICQPFIDDGKSAKNFDRPDWKKLEDYIQKNHKSIDYLIVMKYDRFSRNVAEALNMIETLEKKYRITILSVNERFFVDPSSPFYFKMRADMLVQGEFELRVIRERTVFGIKQANKEGRYTNRAPFGYKNVRDEQGKPALEIDPSRAEAVKRCFELFLTGVTPINIRRSLPPESKIPAGRSFISILLQNPLYAGLIKSGDQLLPGKHEPIIDLLTFNQARARFRKESEPRYSINEDVPLRGVLHCACGKLMTAGKSKGKTKYYWYYKCSSHLDLNLSACKAHDQLGEVLDELSLTTEHLQEIKKLAEAKLKTAIKAMVVSQNGVKAKVEATLKKLESLEQKFIENQISHDTYSKWHQSYNEELDSYKVQDPVKEANIWKRYEKETEKLQDLKGTYVGLPVLQKQRFINLVFNYSLSYELNTFTASDVIPPFTHAARALNEKGLLKINNPIAQIPLRTRKEPLIELFELLSA